jgi:hypothetical protein
LAAERREPQRNRPRTSDLKDFDHGSHARIDPGLCARREKESAPATVTETEMLMSDCVTGCVKAEELEAGFHEIARIMAIDSRQFEEGKKCLLFLDIFHGRALVLNQTNLRTLIAAFGPSSENWTGQEVTVNRTTADFKGKPVPAIRLEAMRRLALTATPIAPKPKPATVTIASAPADYPEGYGGALIDDDIPF